MYRFYFHFEEKGHRKWDPNNQQVYTLGRAIHMCGVFLRSDPIVCCPTAIIINRLTLSIDTQSRTPDLRYGWLPNFIGNMLVCLDFFFRIFFSSGDVPKWIQTLTLLRPLSLSFSLPLSLSRTFCIYPSISFSFCRFSASQRSTLEHHSAKQQHTKFHAK